MSFYLGLRNNSSYDRTREARKIRGAIVNDSRTFANAVITLLHENPDENIDAIKKSIVYLDLAWAVSLRYMLRIPKTWEHKYGPKNTVFVPTYNEMMNNGLDKELPGYISEPEPQHYKTKTNIPSQILKKQSDVIQELTSKGLISDVKQVRFHRLIGRLYDNQGMAGRIKNFPLPRQYASVALWMTYAFCALIPFGLLDISMISSELWTWLTIPFSGLIIRTFFLMEGIGDNSENPYEGTYNDVPISAITRSIGIDRREMLNDEKIPKPYPEENGFLM